MLKIYKFDAAAVFCSQNLHLTDSYSSVIGEHYSEVTLTGACYLQNTFDKNNWTFIIISCDY